MHKILFSISALTCLVLLAVYYTEGNDGPRETEVASVIKISQSKNTDDYKLYINNIEGSGNAEYHKQIGKKIYTHAFAKGMYSKNKIKLLKMAKAHLLASKRNEVINEK